MKRPQSRSQISGGGEETKYIYRNPATGINVRDNERETRTKAQEGYPASEEPGVYGGRFAIQATREDRRPPRAM